jgi:Family of unknown function (DUF6286)
MRGINRVASALLGLVLIAFGLLVALETAWVAAGSAPLWLPLDRWYANLMHRTLGSVGFLVTAIVVGVIGLIILVLEVLPRKPDRVVTGQDEAAGRRDGRWWLRRRSVERRAATMAAAVTGVNHARAQVLGRPQRWHLRLAATGLSERRDAVNRAVREELQRLDVDDRIEVQVDLRKPGRRVS